MLPETKNNRILIVDDEEGICKLVQGILEDEGYDVEYALNVKSALKLFSEKKFDLAILDIWLSDGSDDGILLMQELLKVNATLPIIMMSGHGTVETAVEAIKKGAYDFIEKPFKTDRLLVIVQRGLELSTLKNENKNLKDNDNNIENINLTGNSNTLSKFKTRLAEASISNRPLIVFSADTKEAVKIAKYIHANSSHNDIMATFFDCSKASQSNVKSFFKDNKNKRIILNKLNKLPAPLERELLAYLNNITCSPILISNSNAPKDHNIIMDTLNPIRIEAPTLLDRIGDLNELLDDYYKSNGGGNKLSTRFSEEAMNWLKAYNWPGGISQLNNFVEWLMILEIEQKRKIEKNDFLPYFIAHTEISKSDSDNTLALQDNFLDVPLKPAREIFEVAYLQEQLVRFNYNISKVSSFVEMERSALHRKLKSLNIATSNDTSSKNQKNIKTAKEA